MTKEEILAMKPGIELDVLIAEKVMGWKRKGEYFTDGNFLRTINETSFGSFLPSTDINAAWKVVNKFEYVSVSKGTIVNNFAEQFEGKGWFKKCFKCTINIDKEFSAIGETAPEAICKAALMCCVKDGKK